MNLGLYLGVSYPERGKQLANFTSSQTIFTRWRLRVSQVFNLILS